LGGHLGLELICCLQLGVWSDWSTIRLGQCTKLTVVIIKSFLINYKRCALTPPSFVIFEGFCAFMIKRGYWLQEATLWQMVLS